MDGSLEPAASVKGHVPSFLVITESLSLDGAMVESRGEDACWACF
jgi:hypothetical protein